MDYDRTAHIKSLQPQSLQCDVSQELFERFAATENNSERRAAVRFFSSRAQLLLHIVFGRPRLASQKNTSRRLLHRKLRELLRHGAKKKLSCYTRVLRLYRIIYQAAAQQTLITKRWATSNKIIYLMLVVFSNYLICMDRIITAGAVFLLSSLYQGFPANCRVDCNLIVCSLINEV